MVTVQTFTSIINQLLPEPHAGLLNGILFGTKAALPRDFYQELVTTGTLHIIALSGMNISILTGLVNLALLRIISRRIASLLTIVTIAGFVGFVGASPSVIRAAIMGSISLLAVVFGRQYWAFLSWILAVGIMLLLNFDWLGDLSFQLSVLATLGIILFGKKQMGSLPAEGGMPWFSRRQGPTTSSPLSPGDKAVTPLKTARLPADNQRSAGESILRSTEVPTWSFYRSSRDIGVGTSLSEDGDPFYDSEDDRRTSPKNVLRPRRFTALRFFWGFVGDDLRLTLAAQSLTIPLIFWKFQRISVISPLTNILIGWIIQPLTVMGFVTAFSGWVFLPLGQLFAWVTWVPLSYLVTIVEWTSKVPGASFGS